MSNLNPTSATTAAGLPSSSRQQRGPWPFAATLLCASLLGIVLAFCARTMLPAFALDGEFLTSVVCSSEKSAASSQGARTGD